jgi:GDP-mannose 4,6 dehydratase
MTRGEDLRINPASGVSGPFGHSRVSSRYECGYGRKRVAKIKCGLATRLLMGNLDANRDWGVAGDYLWGMWTMLQQAEPKDYVLPTGKTHSVRELLDVAFDAGGLDWQTYVEIDPKFIRPAEVDLLCGDATKAREKLGWEPEVTFEELIKIMVEADLGIVRLAANGNGYVIFRQMPEPLVGSARLALLLVAISLAIGLPASVFNGIFVGLQRNEIPASSEFRCDAEFSRFLDRRGLSCATDQVQFAAR